MSSEATSHIGPPQYLLVFAALICLTGLTIWVAFQDFGWMNNVLAVGIAVVKATLVILWFMHVRYSSRLTKSVLVIAIAFFLVLVAFVYADELTRGMLAIDARPPMIGG
jgi:cytochrome c oxidase subunit 4